MPYGYGTSAGFDAWLVSFGRTLPVGSPASEVLVTRASGYIDMTYGPRFVGTPTDPLGQVNEWPRTDAEMYGVAIATDAIPDRVVAATYEAAWIEANSPGSLIGGVINPNARVKRSKVDVIEEEYFEPSVATGSTVQATNPISPLIEGILAPLLVPVDAFPAVLVV